MTELIVLGLGNVSELFITLFLLHLLTYLMTMTRNVLTTVLVVLYSHSLGILT